MITLPKPGKDPKLPQNISPITLLSRTAFEKLVLKIALGHIKRKNC
jgi:hypothetical protein